jgi:carbamoyl-phosphate synthase large subunit
VLRFAGAINIQCRMRGDEPVIFEINPRFSGGIPLTLAAGADFPKMLVKLAMGVPVEPAIGQYRAELWMTSYESSMFLDPAQLRMPSLGERRARPRIGEVA